MGTLLIAIASAVFALLLRVFLALVVGDSPAWLMWISERLLQRALRKLPVHLRQRFNEEWRAHLSEVPGVIAKFFCAIGFFRAAWKMSSIAEKEELKPKPIVSFRPVVGAPVPKIKAGPNDPFRIFIRPTGSGFEVVAHPVATMEGATRESVNTFRPDVESLTELLASLNLPALQIDAIRKGAAAGNVQEIGGSRGSVLRIFRRGELELLGFASKT